jgi:hypothetical protein
VSGKKKKKKKKKRCRDKLFHLDAHTDLCPSLQSLKYGYHRWFSYGPLQDGNQEPLWFLD